uniref:Uncharacterized protein n=1 Tax=Panagrolaimus sp. PS1159 TaxID=55785 RepID=A0AC35GA15_9BILA
MLKNYSNFIRKCARCLLPIRAEEYVQKCRENAYHSTCFYCIYCGKPLKIGDEYYCVNTQIICSNDYHLMLQHGHQPGILPPPPGPLSDLPFPSLHSLPPFFPESEPNHRRNSSKKPPKRPRTILNSQQRKAFKIAFDKGSKPTKKVREQLASETGLSVRVVQVWFQNQRAKIKKIQRKQGIQNCDPSTTESGLSPDSKSDDLKSPSSSKFMDDSDLEDIDVDSGRSSSATIQRQNSSSSFFSPEMSDKDPMEKLYHMNSTYFAFA